VSNLSEVRCRNLRTGTDRDIVGWSTSNNCGLFHNFFSDFVLYSYVFRVCVRLTDSTTYQGLIGRVFHALNDIFFDIRRGGWILE